MAPLRAALRAAAAVPFPREWIAESLLEGAAEDLFRRAQAEGLAALEVAERRGRLPSVVGAVAEALAARILDSVGFVAFAQLVEPGARGVDLLLLSPEERVLALEVKGTLRQGSLPRLRRSRLKQMSAAWLDSANPVMEEWDLAAADLYGGVIVVDLRASEARLAVTGDFSEFTPGAGLDRLDDLLGLIGR